MCIIVYFYYKVRCFQRAKRVGKLKEKTKQTPHRPSRIEHRHFIQRLCTETSSNQRAIASLLLRSHPPRHKRPVRCVAPCLGDQSACRSSLPKIVVFVELVQNHRVENIKLHLFDKPSFKQEKQRGRQKLQVVRDRFFFESRFSEKELRKGFLCREWRR